jgi:hypothetical protein
MSDGAGPARRGARGDALGLRLALAFLAVALLAGLTAAFAAADEPVVVSAIMAGPGPEPIAVCAGAIGPVRTRARGVAQQMPPAPRERERGGQHSGPVQADEPGGHGHQRGHDDGRDRTDHDHGPPHRG